MHLKQLFLCALFTTSHLTVHAMIQEKNKAPLRLTLDTAQLAYDIKEMFLTQAVFGANLNFDHDDWKRVSQNNPFLLKELKDINYDCLCNGTNEQKYKDFCQKYKIPNYSYTQMRRLETSHNK